MQRTSGKFVLILEDEPLVALDLETTLSEAGFDVAHLTSTCKGALEWLQDNSPDVAVLDIGLSDGDCVPVAQLLVERGIPFVVFSVQALDDGHHPIFLQGHWITKPSPTENIVAALVAQSRSRTVSVSKLMAKAE